jgi:predicted ATPase
LFYFGQFDAAREQLHRGIALDDAAAVSGDRRPDLLLYAEQPGTVCRLYSAWSEWFLGYPERALVMSDAALALGERLSHPRSLAFALGFAAVVHLWRREFEAARRRGEAAIAVAREHSLAEWLAIGMICRGVALAGLGRLEDGMAELHAGLAAWERVGDRVIGTMWLGFTAEAHAAADQLDAAFAVLGRATALAEANGELFYQAELHRLRGAFHAQRGDIAEAELWLHEAIELARSQSARSLELRAAMALAHLWRSQGRRADARNVLSPVYDWFIEGFDTLDLAEAKALLDTLK